METQTEPAEPPVPVLHRWQCGHCGGGGLDSHGQTCAHCAGHGHC